MSRRVVRCRWLLITFLALCGCTSNPITGRSQLTLISEQAAIARAAPAYASLVGELSRRGRIESGTPRAERVQEITDRLIAEAVQLRPDSVSWNWSVVVINDPRVVNAFCAAGGKMAIYTGFWDKVHATDDEIANVMGHEISHALAGHTAEKMSVAIAAGIGVAVVAGVASRNSNDPYAFQRNRNLAAIVATLGITLPNSREAESEADQIGVELAARAGYDPAAAVSLWHKMSALEGPGLEFFHTHPSSENRAEHMQTLLAKVDPLYRRAIASKPALRRPVLASRKSIPAQEMRSGGDAVHISMASQAMTFSSGSVKPSDRPYPDLMTAVLHSDRAAISHFLEQGADINEKANGVTYLIAAVLHGDLELVKFLVSRGADVNRVDSRGLPPIMYAKAGGPDGLSITMFLEEAGAKNPFASR